MVTDPVETISVLVYTVYELTRGIVVNWFSVRGSITSCSTRVTLPFGETAVEDRTYEPEG